MMLSPEKEKRLRAVSDSRGIIAALAIDQRSALKNMIAKSKGIETSAIPNEMLEQFKVAVSRVLTPHASSILLDPEYGLPASKSRAKNAGLLLAYEQTGYDKNIPGRLPRLLDHFSVRRLVDAGADCIKILLYYSPFSTGEVNDLKSAWVERIGAECQAADVPYFLELVGYADGLRRAPNTWKEVLINGKRAPLIGRVSMEKCTVNVTGFEVSAGDEVVLLGKQGSDEITAEEVASWLGTSNYEVVTTIMPYLPRG